MFHVRRQVLNAFLEASKNTYPHEFLGLLAGNIGKKTVEELVVVPAVFGKNFSEAKLYLVPFDSTIIGTCHSHPSSSNSPSREDTLAFSKTGIIHLIACFPYEAVNVKAFDARGEKLQIKII